MAAPSTPRVPSCWRCSPASWWEWCSREPSTTRLDACVTPQHHSAPHTLRCLPACPQFYSWYFHTLPFLLWHTRLPTVVRIAMLAGIEYAYNVFPSTSASSAILQVRTDRRRCMANPSLSHDCYVRVCVFLPGVPPGAFVGRVPGAYCVRARGHRVYPHQRRCRVAEEAGITCGCCRRSDGGWCGQRGAALLVLLTRGAVGLGTTHSSPLPVLFCPFLNLQGLTVESSPVATGMLAGLVRRYHVPLRIPSAVSTAPARARGCLGSPPHAMRAVSPLFAATRRCREVRCGPAIDRMMPKRRGITKVYCESLLRSG